MSVSTFYVLNNLILGKCATQRKKGKYKKTQIQMCIQKYMVKMQRIKNSGVSNSYVILPTSKVRLQIAQLAFDRSRGYRRRREYTDLYNV